MKVVYEEVTEKTLKPKHINWLEFFRCTDDVENLKTMANDKKIDLVHYHAIEMPKSQLEYHRNIYSALMDRIKELEQ